MLCSPQVTTEKNDWIIDGYLKQMPCSLKRARAPSENDNDQHSKSRFKLFDKEYLDMKPLFINLINNPEIPLKSFPFLFVEYMYV